MEMRENKGLSFLLLNFLILLFCSIDRREMLHVCVRCLIFANCGLSRDFRVLAAFKSSEVSLHYIWATSHPGWPQKRLIGNYRFNRKT